MIIDYKTYNGTHESFKNWSFWSILRVSFTTQAEIEIITLQYYTEYNDTQHNDMLSVTIRPIIVSVILQFRGTF